MNDLIEFLEMVDLKNNHEINNALIGSMEQISQVFIDLSPKVDAVVEVIIKSGLI